MRRVVLIIDRNMIVYPYLIVGYVKQLAPKQESIYLVIWLCPNGIIIVLLNIVHTGPIAKVLLYETLVVPVHLFPRPRNIWVLAEHWVLSVPFLVRDDVVEHLVHVKPVA